MIFNNDEVGKMVSRIKSLATPLQDLILHEAMTDREYANKAAAELADKDAELLALRERVAEQDKQLTWWLETYDITMPCGHKNRYLLTDGRRELVKDNRGDCVCVMCQLEVADEIDAALKSQ